MFCFYEYTLEYSQLITWLTHCSNSRKSDSDSRCYAFWFITTITKPNTNFNLNRTTWQLAHRCISTSDVSIPQFDWCPLYLYLIVSMIKWLVWLIDWMTLCNSCLLNYINSNIIFPTFYMVYFCLLFSWYIFFLCVDWLIGLLAKYFYLQWAQWLLLFLSRWIYEWMVFMNGHKRDEYV